MDADTVTPNINQPPLPQETISRVSFVDAKGNAVYREIIGNAPHFIPQKLIDNTLNTEVIINKDDIELDKMVENKYNVYPRSLSWLAKFKRSLDE